MSSSAHPALAAWDVCQHLRFAPFPQFLSAADAVNDSWRPLAELDLAPTSDAQGFTLTAALRAEEEQSVPGPHAVHTLRSLLREWLFTTASCIYLTGNAPSFDHRRWLISNVGHSAGSVRHAIVPDQHSSTETASRRQLQEDAATAIVTTASPLVEAIRTITRVGHRTLWSYVIDTSCFAMINLARQLHHDRERAWHRADDWAQDLYNAGVPHLSRPQLVRYAPDPRDVWAIRGACCLDFKDNSHGYCLTCPVLPHDDRSRQWQTASLRTP